MRTVDKCRYICYSGDSGYIGFLIESKGDDMPRTIHKYPLEITDVQTVTLPRDYRILTVQEQNGRLVMWAEVSLTAKPVSINIAIYDTGNLIPDEHLIRKYIGTVQMPDKLVWHVCEVK